MSDTTFTYPADQPLILIEREFDAPRELVWQVLTSPDHAARWFGPRAYTNPICEMDVRVGGKWLIETHTTDGSVVRFGGTYLEVEPPERLVNTFGVEGMFEGRHTVDSVTLEDLDGRTRLTATSRFDEMGDRDEMLAQGMEWGARQSYDRMAERVAALKASPSEREIVSTRLIDAPRELVFRVWNDPEHLSRWWGPSGFTTPVVELDARPGGRRRIVMRGPDGVEYPNRGTYREIVEPERIVFTEGWDVPAGETPPHGDMLMTVTFDDVGGRTLVTLRNEFASVQDLETARGFGAVEGGIETLDRLATVVGDLQPAV